LKSSTTHSRIEIKTHLEKRKVIRCKKLKSRRRLCLHFIPFSAASGISYYYYNMFLFLERHAGSKKDPHTFDLTDEPHDFLFGKKGHTFLTQRKGGRAFLLHRNIAKQVKNHAR